MQDYKSVVSIVRCGNAIDRESVKESVLCSLDLIGSLRTVLCKNDQILIKPNLLAPSDYKTGATTNPHIVAALIDAARGAGAKRIIIGDGSNVGNDTSEAFDKCGYTALANEKGVELVDFKKSEFIPMSLPDGRILRKIGIPRVVLESDVIINVPVMKTHDVFPATLGLKNMKGIIKERDKKRFHIWGLAQCIVDLNKLVLPQVTIMDGTIGMEGLGPVNGKPVGLGLLCASYDVVAVDTVSSFIMGIDPESIEYLKLACEQRLGCGDITEIKVCGLQIEEVQRSFSRLTFESEEFSKYGIKIVDKGSCSGCRNVLTVILNKMRSDNQILKISDAVIIIGPLIDEKIDLDLRRGTKLIKFGSCTKLISTQNEMYIPGCPPHPDDFFEDIL